jgi:Ca-activated chloride channel family protein
VELRETHAEIEIRDTVARKKFRLRFHHPGSDPRAEATFFLALEPDQHVDRFKVRLAGKEAEAELLDQEKARKIYEDIVRKQKDPALLELYGNRLLRIRLFPLPPRSDFDLELETLEALRAEGGLVRVQTLNASPFSFQKPIPRVTVTATISAARPLQTVFSPTHAVNVARKDAREARLTYERQDYVPSGPFTFYYSMGEQELGATVLAYSENGDGAFMLTLSPPAEVREEDRLPRDILFVVDTSGSMNEGGKMAQARAALRKFVESLTDRDRFNLVPFSTEASLYRSHPVPATPEERRAASEFVETLRARGGTNFEEALKLALAQPLRPEATRLVVLLSDGTPTIGERDAAKLVAAAAGLKARVFSFGIGADVNTQLLDRLAIETGGDRQYVHPGEGLAAVVENFARRIDAPVLAEPALAFGPDAGVSEVFPRKLPDLFRGGEMVVFGRFKGDGPRRVTLSGAANGTPVSRTYDLAFSPDRRHDFVPRLWAIQKIDFLIDEIRRRGTAKELVDHIVELAKQYAIVTTYTSFLMVEDVARPAAKAQVEENLRLSRENKFTGQRELGLAKNQQAWRGAYSQEGQLAACNDALGRGHDARGVAQTLAQQRVVGHRAFYNSRGSWVEGSFEAQNARVLKFGSDEYFRFARENPEAGPMLALGQNVVFRNRGEWIRVEG